VAKMLTEARLTTRNARAKLAPEGRYYKALERDLHLGYRRHGPSGVWFSRTYLGAGRYRLENLGAADDKQPADGHMFLSFEQAARKARDLFQERGREAAGLPKRSGGPYLVRDAVADYLAALDQKGARSIPSTRNALNAHVLPRLGDLECAKLTTPLLQKWLADIAAAPPRLRTREGEAQKFGEPKRDDPEWQRRRRCTANRVLTNLRAALNGAIRHNKIASDRAWRGVEPFEQVNAPKLRYLTVDEARRLVNAAEPDFRRLVQGALETGARYGELCALDVADFGRETGTVHVVRAKGGKGRFVHLSEDGRAFFAALCAGRAGSEPMFKRADGSRWKRPQQDKPMRAACQRAKIKPPASFHALRHTWASLSVMAGMPLMVVAKNLGHRDTRMCELHYAHLAPSYLAETIKAHAPRFGFALDKKVTAIAGARRG